MNIIFIKNIYISHKSCNFWLDRRLMDTSKNMAWRIRASLISWDCLMEIKPILFHDLCHLASMHGQTSYKYFELSCVWSSHRKHSIWRCYHKLLHLDNKLHLMILLCCYDMEVLLETLVIYQWTASIPVHVPDTSKYSIVYSLNPVLCMDFLQFNFYSYHGPSSSFFVNYTSKRKGNQQCNYKGSILFLNSATVFQCVFLLE